ncbi:MAG: fatty acid desaturase [Crocinitomix sp.]|jgi:fatty acid desaturase
MLIENNITIPWFVVSIILAYYEYYWLALPFSFFFFLTALRQVHNGFHKSLGTSKFLTWFSLYSNSILMVVSMRAVRFNHLRHHKYEMGEEDYEAKPGRMSALEAILYGPIHIYKIHKVTLEKGTASDRLHVALELASVAAFVFTAFYFQIDVAIYHIIIMLVGEFLSAFFAVWTVHHDTEDHPHLPRTQRTKWKNKISFNMFYHLEHHLFPAVPTIKLPVLVDRIDAAVPDLLKRSTF